MAWSMPNLDRVFSQWQLLTMLKQEIGIGWQVDGNSELN